MLIGTASNELFDGFFQRLDELETSFPKDQEIPPVQAKEVFKKDFSKSLPYSQGQAWLKGITFREEAEKYFSEAEDTQLPGLGSRLLKESYSPENAVRSMKPGGHRYSPLQSEARGLPSDSPVRQTAWQGFRAAFMRSWSRNLMNSLFDRAYQELSGSEDEISPAEAKQMFGLDTKEPISKDYAMKILADKRTDMERAGVVASSDLGTAGHVAATLGGAIADPAQLLLSLAAFAAAGPVGAGVALFGGRSLAVGRAVSFAALSAAEVAITDREMQARDVRHGEREAISWKEIALTAGTFGAVGGAIGRFTKSRRPQDSIFEAASPGLKNLAFADKVRFAHAQELFGGKEGYMLYLYRGIDKERAKGKSVAENRYFAFKKTISDGRFATDKLSQKIARKEMDWQTENALKQLERARPIHEKMEKAFSVYGEDYHQALLGGKMEVPTYIVQFVKETIEEFKFELRRYKHLTGPRRDTLLYQVDSLIKTGKHPEPEVLKELVMSYNEKMVDLSLKARGVFLKQEELLTGFLSEQANMFEHLIRSYQKEVKKSLKIMDDILVSMPKQSNLILRKEYQRKTKDILRKIRKEQRAFKGGLTDIEGYPPEEVLKSFEDMRSFQKMVLRMFEQIKKAPGKEETYEEAEKLFRDVTEFLFDRGLIKTIPKPSSRLELLKALAEMRSYPEQFRKIVIDMKKAKKSFKTMTKADQYRHRRSLFKFFKKGKDGDFWPDDKGFIDEQAIKDIYKGGKIGFMIFPILFFITFFGESVIKDKDGNWKRPPILGEMAKYIRRIIYSILENDMGGG